MTDTSLAASTKGSEPPWMRDRNRVVSVVKAVILILSLVAILFPILNVLSVSLMSQQEILQRAGSLRLIPLHPTLDAYRSIFAGGLVARSLLVSIGVTVVGTVLSLLVSAMMAYGLSVDGLPARRGLLMVLLLTFLFHPGIIPLFLTVKSTGLLDTYASLIFPTLLSTFNVIVLRSFFMGIPREIIDSANVDGANYWRIFWNIVLPLSKPVLAVIGLFYAVGYWDAFFHALLYLNDAAKWPIQLLLQQYVVANSALPESVAQYASSSSTPPPEQSVQMAVVVVATIPILIVYPFLQKYFVKGVLTGAVKG